MSAEVEMLLTWLVSTVPALAQECYEEPAVLTFEEVGGEGTYYFPLVDGLDLGLFVVSTPEGDHSVAELYERVKPEGREGEHLAVTWTASSGLVVEAVPDPCGEFGCGGDDGEPEKRWCFWIPWIGKICVIVIRA